MAATELFVSALDAKHPTWWDRCMSSGQLRDVISDREASPTVTQDVAFELLSCRRRRYVIHRLKQRDGRVEMRDLVVQVAAWENGVAPTQVTREQRMRVYTALRQSHLPKLDKQGVIRFDPDRGTIELTQAASSLEVYLDVVPHNDIPWSTYYLGLSVLCTGFVIGLASGVTPFSWIPNIVGVVLITLLFAISAIFHARYDRRMRLGAGNAPPE